MNSVCAPGTRREPKRRVKRPSRAVRATPVEYKSHNRWLLVIVYATWLWILWNVLVFAFLGVRDRTQVRDLYPEHFLRSLSQVSVDFDEPEPVAENEPLLLLTPSRATLIPLQSTLTDSEPLDADADADADQDKPEPLADPADQGWFPQDASGPDL